MSSLFWESLGETEIAAIGGLVAALHPPDAPNKADHRDYPPTTETGSGTKTDKPENDAGRMAPDPAEIIAPV